MRILGQPFGFQVRGALGAMLERQGAALAGRGKGRAAKDAVAEAMGH